MGGRGRGGEEGRERRGGLGMMDDDLMGMMIEMVVGRYAACGLGSSCHVQESRKSISLPMVPMRRAWGTTSSRSGMMECHYIPCTYCM